MKKSIIIAIVNVLLLFGGSKISMAQNEFGVIGGLSKTKALGFSVGGHMTLNPFMGSRSLETLYLELDKTSNGWGIVPKVGLAFSPHLGLGKGFKSKNKYYGSNPKHYLEISGAGGFYFTDGFGIYIRPEVGYLLSTPFEKFKIRAAYGRDFEVKERVNFDSSKGIFSVKFIYIFALTGMYI